MAANVPSQSGLAHTAVKLAGDVTIAAIAVRERLRRRDHRYDAAIGGPRVDRGESSGALIWPRQMPEAPQ